MAYILPRYIANQDQPSSVLNYIWDDTRAYLDFRYDASGLVVKMMDTTIQSNIALCIGIYEWIIWRFHRLSDDPAPFQLAEAAWCGNIRADYVRYFSFSYKDHLGPVQCPLCLAMNHLVGVITDTEGIGDCLWRLRFFASCAIHVLPETQPFEKWLQYVTDRLLLLYPEPEDDPYEDIFDDHEDERRGPLVARETLDPSFDYYPEQAPVLLDTFLRNVDHTNNSFLRSPEELMELGIEHPYRVLP